MKTITGPFDNYDDANDAVGELEATGVPCSDKGVGSWPGSMDRKTPWRI